MNWAYSSSNVLVHTIILSAFKNFVCFSIRLCGLFKMNFEDFAKQDFAINVEENEENLDFDNIFENSDSVDWNKIANNFKNETRLCFDSDWFQYNYVW